MPQLAIILAVILFTASCTTRVEYTGVSPAEAVIDVNTAAAADLERLPGIGPKTAAAIISHRTEYGAFRRREHLLLVPGISERRYRATLAPAAR
ncbi:MAG: helix-hairpin-helix domain-containing protein [Acidobacteriota bacterium]|nr:MAG: helix-hairpin-helix domain-containing protein [Acidobacteriota bacterium]